jgi:hypothetical protein
MTPGSGSSHPSVIPAKAGTQPSVPAFAGDDGTAAHPIGSVRTQGCRYLVMDFTGQSGWTEAFQKKIVSHGVPSAFSA